jgi:DNA-binding CsgD family transcriptional regulator
MPPSEAPIPTLPVGAGGPRQRAAGRVTCVGAVQPRRRAPATEPLAAHVVEVDPLLRLHAVAAVGALGYAVVPEESERPGYVCSPAVVFVGLDHVDRCARCGGRCLPVCPGRADLGRQRALGAVRSSRPLPKAASGAPLIVGYCAGSPALAEAHHRHGCADFVLALRAVAGRPRFLYLAADPCLPADLTPREADVLLLVLDGFTTAAVAKRLCLSKATVTSHCRAILRKCEAIDRATLRARLLVADPPVTWRGEPVESPWRSAANRPVSLSSSSARGRRG